MAQKAGKANDSLSGSRVDIGTITCVGTICLTFNCYQTSGGQTQGSAYVNVLVGRPLLLLGLLIVLSVIGLVSTTLGGLIGKGMYHRSDSVDS
jgi:hypothetical protein